MQEIQKVQDHFGDNVIYVEKCTNFKYEDPDTPKTPIYSIHNVEFAHIYDILNRVENYYNDSGRIDT